MRDKLALIVSYFLPRRVKLYAMMDWMDQTKEGVITIEDSEFILRVEKTRKV
jgi:hypothetical protein